MTVRLASVSYTSEMARPPSRRISQPQTGLGRIRRVDPPRCGWPDDGYTEIARRLAGGT
jgi:hypothetical protein